MQKKVGNYFNSHENFYKKNAYLYRIALLKVKEMEPLLTDNI